MGLLPIALQTRSYMLEFRKYSEAVHDLFAIFYLMTSRLVAPEAVKTREATPQVRL